MNNSRRCKLVLGMEVGGRWGEEAATFRFGFSKRQSRTGLRNSDGKFVPYVKLSHSSQPGTLRWVYALGDSLVSQPKAVSSPAKGSRSGDYIR